jgi:heme-degrading monooxygenase HmoA
MATASSGTVRELFALAPANRGGTRCQQMRPIADPSSGVCETCPMITEHALLPVISGQEEDFEAAFDRARLIIASMPGFVSLSLSRSIETPNTYLLLVKWDSLEDHTVGFRGSPQYQQWKELLHRYYEPFPLVEHYELVSSAPQ